MQSSGKNRISLARQSLFINNFKDLHQNIFKKFKLLLCSQNLDPSQDKPIVSSALFNKAQKLCDLTHAVEDSPMKYLRSLQIYLNEA